MTAAPATVTAVDDGNVRSMAVGAVFSDFGGGRINCIDFHRKDDLLVTASEVCDSKFSNDGRSKLLSTTDNHIYVLDAFAGDKRCGFSLEPSATPMEASLYSRWPVHILRKFFALPCTSLTGFGDGTLHAWNINSGEDVASWSSCIGVASYLNWSSTS